MFKALLTFLTTHTYLKSQFNQSNMLGVSIKYKISTRVFKLYLLLIPNSRVDNCTLYNHWPINMPLHTNYPFCYTISLSYGSIVIYWLQNTLFLSFIKFSVVPPFSSFSSLLPSLIKLPLRRIRGRPPFIIFFASILKISNLIHFFFNFQNTCKKNNQKVIEIFAERLI